ncbi:MAG: hypothetical protein IPP29_16655 [Bacteroidetes bacterium]|nr:hypothetical protein [Bacteroidota bacterium]
MFDETKKYKHNGHFFFKKGNKLSDVSKEVPALPGVYYILRLAMGKIDLVYIGKSGTITQSGKFKNQLFDLGPSVEGSVSTQIFFDKK